MKLTTYFQVLQTLRMGGSIPLLTGMTSRLAKGHLYLSLEGQKKIMKILKQTGLRFELDTLQTREEFNH